MHNKIRVLIADDHRAVRNFIRQLLCPAFDVIGSVEDGNKLIQAAVELRPDVIVSDVSMPGRSGPEAMKELKATLPQVPFVLMSIDSGYALDLVNEGAAAFVDKLDLADDLAPAIRAAAAGQTYLSRTICPGPRLDVLQMDRLCLTAA